MGKGTLLRYKVVNSVVYKQSIFQHNSVLVNSVVCK